MNLGSFGDHWVNTGPPQGENRTCRRRPAADIAKTKTFCQKKYEEEKDLYQLRYSTQKLQNKTLLLRILIANTLTP